MGAGETSDLVLLEGLRVECIVGIHPEERHRPQPLEADVAVGLARRPGGFGRSLADSLDYDLLEGMLRFVLLHGRFLLVEEAAEALAATALAAPARRPDHCRVALRKPLALAGRAVPAVVIERAADELSPVVGRRGKIVVEILHAGPSCRVERVRMPSGAAIPPHLHAADTEAELALHEGLELNGRPLAAGIGHAWPAGFVHAYRNGSPGECHLLRVVRPGPAPEETPVAEIVPHDDPRTLAVRRFGLPSQSDH